MQDNKLIAECCDAAGEVYASEGFKVEWPEESKIAQAAEPVVELSGIDEYGPMLNWFKHWTEFPLGAQFYDAPQPDRVAELDGRDMYVMLSSMQSGEMTVSRGVELLDMWLAGTYSDDEVPPATYLRDELPTERIAELEAEVARLRKALRTAFDHIEMDELRISHATDAAAIDAAIAAKGAGHAE